MARCNDCNKFVGFEQADPEDNLDIEAGDRDTATGIQTATINGDIRIVLQCSECGTDLREANIDVDESVEFTHEPKDCDGDLEIDVDSDSSNDRYEGKGRGAKHFYGADVEVTISCSKCKATVSHSFSVEEQSSSFDEC
jgi:hypothetical protein